MKSCWIGLGLTLFLLGGCYDNSNDAGPAYSALSCRQFKTCGSCTLVLGCGWCSFGDTGVCTSEPNACWRATTFDWTWEANFCPAEADGGAPPERPDANAGGDARTTDADAARDAGTGDATDG